MTTILSKGGPKASFRTDGQEMEIAFCFYSNHGCWNCELFIEKDKTMMLTCDGEVAFNPYKQIAQVKDVEQKKPLDIVRELINDGTVQEAICETIWDADEVENHSPDEIRIKEPLLVYVSYFGHYKYRLCTGLFELKSDRTFSFDGHEIDHRMLSLVVNNTVFYEDVNKETDPTGKVLYDRDIMTLAQFQEKEEKGICPLEYMIPALEQTLKEKGIRR